MYILATFCERKCWNKWAADKEGDLNILFYCPLYFCLPAISNKDLFHLMCKSYFFWPNKGTISITKGEGWGDRGEIKSEEEENLRRHCNGSVNKKSNCYLLCITFVQSMTSTWGPFHQPIGVKRKCTGAESLLKSVSPIKLSPILPVHTTRR